MKRTRVAAAAFCLAAMVAMAAMVVMAGCGKDAPTAAEIAPFEAAIGAYLKSHSMGMKVAEVKSLEIERDTATAVCAMQEAGGLYGNLSVKWTFTFSKNENGVWQVGTLDKP